MNAEITNKMNLESTLKLWRFCHSPVHDWQGKQTPKYVRDYIGIDEADEPAPWCDPGTWPTQYTNLSVHSKQQGHDQDIGDTFTTSSLVQMETSGGKFWDTKFGNLYVLVERNTSNVFENIPIIFQTLGYKNLLNLSIRLRVHSEGQGDPVGLASPRDCCWSTAISENQMLLKSKICPPLAKTNFSEQTEDESATTKARKHGEVDESGASEWITLPVGIQNVTELALEYDQFQCCGVQGGGGLITERTVRITASKKLWRNTGSWAEMGL
ncbi:hypothetical protein CROQUDRAFT_135878 [Cronartium quercuum f. sp. fusiforme G11]|uniref:Uncharacterized protein n=1 Tax=Cronartium quercuum f. sp. fusiforme G11 TaxID=708437 RepID=A0A9P6NAB7_9BASI|nr:hypothetical protein CROQUDRAFT_135878 [Cronartium quercuum f. sp. fusiforme G11]